MAEATTTPAATTATQVLNTLPPQQTTTTGAAATTTATGISVGASTPPTWVDSLNPQLKEFVQEQGFKEPGEAVEAYQNLIKLRGVPADKLLRTPDSYTDPKEQEAALTAIYDRLGRPKEAKDYNVEIPKEGGDQAQADWAKDLFHKAGLNKNQAEAISKAWNERQALGMKTAQENSALTSKQAVEGLKREWGAAYDQNIQIARAGQTALGWDDAKVDKMSATLGLGETLKMLHDTGRKIGEATFVPGGKENPAFTPEGAQEKIKNLMKDKSFVEKLESGDPTAGQQWRYLHEQLANGQQHYL